jgi:hypothetical protein
VTGPEKDEEPRQSEQIGPLDYYSNAHDRKGERFQASETPWNIAGWISLIAAMVQIPWFICVGLATIGWEEHGGEMAIVELVLMPLPAYLSVAFGCVSLMNAGITRRNLTGMIGLGLGIAMILFVLIFV